MTVYYTDDQVTLHHGRDLDVLHTLPDGSVNCVVTSPPYFGLRDYGVAGQRGLEGSPAEYVAGLVEVFVEVRRVLADDGTVFLNLGDSYASASNGSSQSRQPSHAPAYGSDGTVQPDSLAPGSAYSDLCDGCRAAIGPHSARTDQPRAESEPLREPKDRDSGRPGSAPASPVASVPAAQESTTPLSSRRPPGSCSHCDNCGVCLSVLRSSSRDAHLCARRDGYNYGTAQHESAHHNQGTDASGMAWLNYTAGPKNLLGIPWLTALALQRDGWVLRNAIVWAKPNAMPESVTDRLATRYELVFLLTKSRRYWFDLDAIREPYEPDSLLRREKYGRHVPGLYAPGDRKDADRGGPMGFGGMVEPHPAGRNPGDVWTIPTAPFAEAHFAVMPLTLAERCIQAGCPLEVCAKCGEPRRRLTEIIAEGNGKGTSTDAKIPVGRSSRLYPTSGRAGEAASRAHLGWSDCGCGAGFRPGIVLDPYSGSGTTGHAALRNGRRYVGIDLNADYHDLALRTRLQQGALIPDVEVAP